MPHHKRHEIIMNHQLEEAEETDGSDEVDRRVHSYLNKILDDTPAKSFERVICCNSSRSLYCEECCRLLVPDDSLPVSIRLQKRKNVDFKSISTEEGRPLHLPFNLHIYLNDRRKSATGLHAVALLSGIDDNNLDSVKLFDSKRDDDDIPCYLNDSSSTYLLFPSPGESVSLESVASTVQTLVVLDCKWTNSNFIRQHEGLSSLQRLQKVHLSSPPKQSYYWRWHNAGQGMLSTIEAIYTAAYEVSQSRHKRLLEAGTITQSDSNDIVTDEDNLIDLLWLFAHQRASTIKIAENNGKPAPCTDEYKSLQREKVKQKGTWRQLRHKEDEQRLMEKRTVKNSDPIKDFLIKEGEDWKKDYAGKFTKDIPTWNNDESMCVRWQVNGYCFKNCNNKGSHVGAKEVPVDKRDEFHNYLKKVRGEF
jgi:hypothetical protein